MPPSPSTPRTDSVTHRPYYSLIHQLNQRYRTEFDRAERYKAELDDIHRSRLWRFLVGVRDLKSHVRRFLASVRRRATFWIPPRPVKPEEPPPFPVLGIVSTPMTARVSIIIPFRDQVELLHGCLRSLRRSTYRRFEVILVDNGSTEPRTQRYLERFQERRRWQVVAHPSPFNFAELCNIGARHARGQYLLFLNNDTEVITPEWLNLLLIAGQQPQVGIAGPMLVYPDETIQHAGMYEHEGAWQHLYRGYPQDHQGDRHALWVVRLVPAVTGACLLIRRSLFQQLGGFDERLPVTMNDVDLCQRAMQKGWWTAITPRARLLHFESLSRGYQAGPATP